MADESAIRRFDKDWAICELSIFYLFQIDAWLFNTNQKAFREKVFEAIILPYILELLAKFTGNNSLQLVSKSRLNTYAQVLNDHHENDRIVEMLIDSLQQELYWSERFGENRPWDIKDNRPVFLAGADEDFALKVKLMAFVTARYPAMTDFMERITQGMTAMGLL